MSCELNDVSCDKCDHRYCPDTLRDLKNERERLEHDITYYADKSDLARIVLIKFDKEHPMIKGDNQ